MTPLVNFDSPAYLRRLLAERGMTLKKRWGQNFLINRGAREKIVSLLGPRPGELVWEIGPGLGPMTRALLESGARVVGFEIDWGLCRFLSESLEGHSSFSLFQGDFLKTWKEAAAREAPARVLGNLPYSSASQMIAAVVEGGVSPRLMVFTVQKELGERMLAKTGTKSYSSFSVLCQAGYETTWHGDLKPGSFYPEPDVVSSVVVMRPRATEGGTPDWALLSELTRALFASRRKTLRNNISTGSLALRFGRDRMLSLLEEEGIRPGDRAEQLEPQAFVRLSRRLEEEATRQGRQPPAGSPPGAL